MSGHGDVSSLALNAGGRIASWAGTPLPLTPKAFDLLVYLATHRERVVPKTELTEALWPDGAVEEANLTQTVFMLRKALRDAGCHADVIVNVPRVGYRFVGEVRNESVIDSPAPPPVPQLSHRLFWLSVLTAAIVLIVWTLTPGTSRTVTTVAVIPFTNHGGAEEQFLADGITDQVGRTIAQAAQMRIAPPDTRPIADPRAFGRALGVEAVLTGAVTVEGPSLSVSASLTDVASGRRLWQSNQRGAYAAMGGRDSATSKLLDSLFATVWPGAPRPSPHEHRSDAYLAFLRGRAHLARRTPHELRAARDAFDEAVALDGAFAEAQAGLADAWTLSGVFGVDSRATAYSTAKQHALKALEVDSQNAEAHTSLAFVLQVWDKRWVEAEAHYQRAIQLNPSSVQAHHWYALLLDSLVRPAEALREIDTAIALAPLSPNVNSDRGMILAHHNRFDEAISQLQKTIAMDAAYADAHMELGWAYARSGRIDLALQSFDRAATLGVPRAQVLAGRGYGEARAGRTAAARSVLRDIEKAEVADRGQKSVLEALVLMALGDLDDAMNRLLEGLPDGEPNAKVGYWELRTHPQYPELLRRSGFSSR